jgi:mono/diheme cytochrome c family protein
MPGPRSAALAALDGAALACAALACAALACRSAEEGAGLDPAAARGKTVYANVCTACHNADPRQPGALGPELAGASLELVEAKVLRGEFPAGYAPKRPGSAMPKYEYLAPNTADIAAYLATVR